MPIQARKQAAPWIVSWMVRQLCDSGRAGISKLNDLINSLGIAAFCRKDASREVLACSAVFKLIQRAGPSLALSDPQPIDVRLHSRVNLDNIGKAGC